MRTASGVKSLYPCDKLITHWGFIYGLTRLPAGAGKRLPEPCNNREDAGDDDNDNAAAVLQGTDERRGRQRSREGGDLRRDARPISASLSRSRHANNRNYRRRDDRRGWWYGDDEEREDYRYYDEYDECIMMNMMNMMNMTQA